MKKKDEKQEIEVASNVYLEKELKLASAIIASIEGSEILADSVKALTSTKDRKFHLLGELEKLRVDKSNCEDEIVNLKEEFGVTDIPTDVEKLTHLNIKLDSVKTAISLIEEKFNYPSQVERDIEDADSDVVSGINSILSGYKGELQSLVDEKVQDILSIYEMFDKVLGRVQNEQKTIPTHKLSSISFSSILPEVKGLDHYIDDTFTLGMAARVRNIKSVN